MVGRTSVLAAAAGIAGTLLIAAAAGVIVVETGAYDVAATDGHTPFGRWALETNMRNSVERQASGLAPPRNITAEMIAAGAGEYKAMCQQCHAGPGVDRDEWAEGMLPLPPRLTETADEWRTREIYWIATHGIKMSGMPAFGPTHDDPTLWNIAAFVSRLPKMTAEEYAAFPAGHGDPVTEEAGAGTRHSDEGHAH